MKSNLNTTAAIGVALALSGVAVLTPDTAAAQDRPGRNAPALRLYDQGGFAGQSVRLTQSSANLSRLQFGDKARSLIAEGRWEVCFDAEYAGNCRVVQGQVSDMGEWSARISSARYLGPSDWGSAGSGEAQAAGYAGAATGAPTSATGPAAEVPEAYVYSTVGFDKIKPELVFDSLESTVSGTYAATQSESELDAIYRGGTYGITSGTVDGQMSGNTATGYWYEPATNAGLQVACENERNGTFIYGRFTLTFNADRTAFSGLRSSCEITPDPVDHEYDTWNGSLIRRQAAAAPRGASRNASAGPNGSPQGGSVDAQGRPVPGVVDRAARAAGDEAERRVHDRIREGIGRLF